MMGLMNEGRLGQDCSASSVDEATDDVLLGRIADGDRRAFQDLMTRYVRTMISLAQRIAGNPDDADEVVQEAFLKVWKLAPRWRRDGEAHFSTWLYRVVLNRALDVRRRKPFAALDEAGDPADPSPDSLDQAINQQRRALLLEAMASLPERQRAALSLHYFSEISAPQAAQVLEVSLSAMESLLIRGKRGLKACLERRGLTSMGDLL